MVKKHLLSKDSLHGAEPHTTVMYYSRILAEYCGRILRMDKTAHHAACL